MNDIYAENHQNDPDNKPTADAARLLHDDLVKLLAHIEDGPYIGAVGVADVVLNWAAENIADLSRELAWGTLQNTRPHPAPPEGEPVAWAVKDFADGWIIYAHEAHARRQAELTGARIERLGLAARPKVGDAPTTKHDDAMALACIHSWDQNPLADHVDIDGPLLKQVAKLFLSTASTLAEREAELAKADAELDWIACHDKQDLEFGPAMNFARKRHAARQQQKS